MKSEKLISVLIIILVPTLIFGSIFSYNLYTDHKKLLKYAEGWKEYSDIKMQEIDKPTEMVGIAFTQYGFSFSYGFIKPRSYPIIQSIFCQDVYAKYTFLMPWGDIESVWVDTQRWAFTK